MTGARKWKAFETPSGFWELHDEDGYALLEDLTESEARDIADIDRIKAERDEAVELLDRVAGVLELSSPHPQQSVDETRAFLTTIKEQG